MGSRMEIDAANEWRAATPGAEGWPRSARPGTPASS